MRQPKLKQLREQVIVLTGGTSGIGLVTARMAARRGAKLVLAARNEHALRRLADEINREGRGEAIYVVADVGLEHDVHRIGEAAIAAFGGFDTWVNNAGITILGRVAVLSVEDMSRLFRTNFWGVVYGCREAAGHLRNRGGAIINIGSAFSDRATPLQSIYSASKHAVRGFTDALRMELQDDNAPVSVTLIKPGRIDTPYGEHARNYEDRQPSHRGMVYPPESVAEAILYCAEHPKREMFVGSQARLIGMLGSLAPGLTDSIMVQTQFRASRSDRPPRAPNDNALDRPGFGLEERGKHPGWIRRTSWYTKAETHPIGATLLVVSAALLLAATFAGRKT